MSHIIASIDELRQQESAIKLPRYSQIVEYDECMFFGVQRVGQENFACRTFWSKLERDSAARYLCEAEEEIEEILNFKIEPTYVQSTVPWRVSNVVFGRWCEVISPGVKTETVIELNSVIDHTNDPAVIGPIAIPTTLTDVHSIVVYHPGTEIEIFPSKVTIGDVGSVGGHFLTIEIPRCRLVKEEFANNDPSMPLNYADPGIGGPFLQEVDVSYISTDTTTQGFLIFPNGDREAVDMQIIDPQIAEFKLVAAGTGGVDDNCGIVSKPISYKNGQCPVQVELNYLSGQTLNKRHEDAIVRLAHSKMPAEPCGCDVVQRLWKRDRFVPEVLTRERLNCPFGLNDGAWISWRFVQAMRIVRSLGNI